MKKTLVILFVLLTSYYNGYTQNILNGTVYDKDSRTAIGYATIGVNERFLGVMSDENGVFVFKGDSRILDSDSITINCLGYKDKKYVVRDVKGENIDIYMDADILKIDEVVVSEKDIRKKDVKIGYSSAGTKMFSFGAFSIPPAGSGRPRITDIGSILTIKHDSDINNLNFYVTINENERMKLRVKFYNVENELPKDIIVNTDIIFDVNDKKKGWISLDLTPYNISFDAGQEIAVSIMLLNPTECEGIALNGNAFSGNCVLRDGVFDIWYKARTVSLYLGATSYRL